MTSDESERSWIPVCRSGIVAPLSVEHPRCLRATQDVSEMVRPAVRRPVLSVLSNRWGWLVVRGCRGQFAYQAAV